MAPTVYLAGPISHLSYGEATDWRDYAIAELAKGGIKGLSPMRGKDYLASLGAISAECAIEGAMNVLSAPPGIMARDFMDCTRSNALLVNLRGAKSVSIGTVLEIGWAYMARNPIICVMEKPTCVGECHEAPTITSEIKNVHEHAMIHQAISYRVETLDEGLAIARAVLGAWA